MAFNYKEVIKVRNITLDLSSFKSCLPKIFAGYEGEHNATNLTIILPDEMLNIAEVIMLTPYFQTSCGSSLNLTSVNIQDVKNSSFDILLPQSVTKQGEVKCQVEGIDVKENILIKTNIGTLVFKHSVGGAIT